MTYKEAYKIIHDDLVYLQLANDDKWNEAILKALDALGKQVPKKPTTERKSFEICYKCQICGKIIISKIDGNFIAGRKQNFCDNCGQELDWSDENCIHYEICDEYKTFDVEMENKECTDFKDESRFIELPCKVGDTVYTVLSAEWDIGEYEVYTTQYIQTERTILRFHAECHSHDVDDITFYDDEIGKTVFLTREEAEKALKECEKNA